MSLADNPEHLFFCEFEHLLLCLVHGFVSDLLAPASQIGQQQDQVCLDLRGAQARRLQRDLNQLVELAGNEITADFSVLEVRAHQ